MATVVTIPHSPNTAHMNKSNRTIAQNSRGMIVTKRKRNMGVVLGTARGAQMEHPK
jgi:hypothetical protein